MIRPGRVIGGRVTGLDGDDVDSPAKRRWPEGLHNVPLPPLVARWKAITFWVGFFGLVVGGSAGFVWWVTTLGHGAHG
jgi:hypothetical protein